MSRTAVSKHLGILAEAELVKGRKVGREKRYMLKPEALKEQRIGYLILTSFGTISFLCLGIMLKKIKHRGDKQNKIKA